MSTFQLIDGNLLINIQEIFVHPGLTPIFRVITSLCNSGMVWIVSAFVMIVIKRTRPIGILVLVALVAALIVDNIILKDLVARIRPYEAFEEVQRLIPAPSDFSFPSGHTGSSFAAAVTIYLMKPGKAGAAAIVLASLIAFSRLYLGVHYPTDVLGGVIIGICIAFAVKWAFTKFMQRRERIQE